MTLVPTVRCSSLSAALSFYTELLDFTLHPSDALAHTGDPGFVVLVRGGHLLFLSSHRGDGAFGQAVSVLVDDVDALWTGFRSRGLEPPQRDSPVHRGPTRQTWGTREFYVDDPDGNTVRFIEGFGSGSPAP